MTWAALRQHAGSWVLGSVGLHGAFSAADKVRFLAVSLSQRSQPGGFMLGMDSPLRVQLGRGASARHLREGRRFGGRTDFPEAGGRPAALNEMC